MDSDWFSGWSGVPWWVDWLPFITSLPLDSNVSGGEGRNAGNVKRPEVSREAA